MGARRGPGSLPGHAPQAAVTAAIDNIRGYELPSLVREDYLASYTGQRFADQLPYVQAYPSELPVLSDLLPTIETPTQIIIGRSDAVVPLENAEYLHDHLANSRLDIIEASKLDSPARHGSYRRDRKGRRRSDPTAALSAITRRMRCLTF